MSEEVEFFRGGEVTQQYYKRSSIDKVCEVFLGGTGGIYVKSQVEKRGAVKAIIKYQLVF